MVDEKASDGLKLVEHDERIKKEIELEANANLRFIKILSKSILWLVLFILGFVLILAFIGGL